jgi:AraC family transcriptional regulator, regulatory protein of adaptative response / methylated-DNA-[protein]-cysteine methyltransferase
MNRSELLVPQGAAGIAVAPMETPVGTLLAGVTDDALCFLEFTDPVRLQRQLATLARLFTTRVEERAHPLLRRLRGELDAYFAGELRDFSLSLSYPGTGFQTRVWDQLRAIPYGETRSYEQVAVALGMPHGTRAVGHANGQNRVAIVVPCHRVINKSGKLGGYGGGLWRKEFLLELERGDRRLL